MGKLAPILLPPLVPAIEAPIPYQFDEPPEGWAFGMMSSSQSEAVVLVSDAGRAVRLPLTALPNIGGVAFKRDKGERLVGAASVTPEMSLLIVTQDGYGRFLTADMVPQVMKLNQRGKTVVARKGVVGMMPAFPNQPIYAITTQRLLPLSVDKLTIEASTRSHKIVKLNQSEKIVGFVADKAQT